MEKGASIYSSSWIIVKYTPNTTVINKDLNASLKWPSIRAWWDHVTLAPEDNRIIVFSRGTLNGLNAWMPIGGQVDPNSILGDNLLWKKAQKNEKKNITSEQIKSNIPQRSPVSTIRVCIPWYVPSREISRHHWYITNIINTSLHLISVTLFEWNQDTSPVVRPRAEMALIKGQGDISTKW